MAMNFVDAMKNETNYKYTENGAVALKSTKNGLVDAFGTLAAMRARSDSDVISTFYKALAEDRALAIKMMFWLRDCRGGAGERRAFRVILKEMAFKYPDIIKANIDNIPYYGRYDDLLCLLDTPLRNDIIEYIKDTLVKDMEDVKKGNYPSLMAKWLPSENASSAETIKNARILIKSLKIEPKVYRKTLSILRSKINVIEKLISSNKWDEIEFDKIPSRASLIYAQAFLRHEPKRYGAYLKDVAEGKAKINADTLFPVDIMKKVMDKTGLGYNYNKSYNEMDIYIYDAMWNNLPNYYEGLDREETGLCVVDTSGSMYGEPLQVAVSLGMYCAEKAKGVFKNHFITFSNQPELQEIKGANIFEKVINLSHANWNQNTDLEAVFDLILKTAVKNHCNPEEIPNKLYIISDMEWDRSNSHARRNSWSYCNPITMSKYTNESTFIKDMQRKFELYGYTMPQLVYWNVNARHNTFHQNVDETGFCMVSGYSPSLFKSVILGTEFEETINEKGEKVIREKLDPISIMMNTLNNERYDKVVVK